MSEFEGIAFLKTKQCCGRREKLIYPKVCVIGEFNHSWNKPLPCEKSALKIEHSMIY